MSDKKMSPDMGEENQSNVIDDLYREASHRVDVLQRASINVPGGYHRCACSPGYPFLFVSKSFEALVGYTKEQLESELDNKFINLVIPEDLPRFAKLEDQISESGSGDVAYRIRRRDGEIRWVQDSTLSVDWEGENCFQCTIADITDFVRQQEDLSRDKAELEQIAENIPCGYHRCSTDNGFRLEFVSESFLETVGYTREEILGKPYFDFVAPEDRDMFMSYEPQLSNDGSVDLAYRIVRKDGERRWIKDSTKRVKQNGKEFYQCILADITDFVHHQEEIVRQNLDLLQEKSLLQTMEANMPAGYHRCAISKGCPFTYIGNNFLDIVGFTKEEIETQFDNLYRNLMWDEDAHLISVYDNMMDLRGHGNAYDTSVYRIKHKDGGYRWVSDSTMFVDLGSNSFFQGIISDITPYIEGLNAAKKEAEASNAAKSTFLFNASHDIRTPMNAIKGFAHIIKDNVNDPVVVAETVAKIEQASETLMTLMNDILDLARIERGKEELNYEVVDLYECGKNLYEMFAAEMMNAGITFLPDGDALHEPVLCDKLKLIRIMMNMLSNAKKFTPAGGTVTFGCKKLSVEGKSTTYRFFVRDTGIGMSEEFQKKAFEQFERERTSTESGITGSGLGMAIIKRLVEIMGGYVEIDSEFGRGTEISAVIKLDNVTEDEIKMAAVGDVLVDLTGKRVLLVEDNAFNREIATYLLEGLNLIVDEAENGFESVEKIISADAGYYDVVLMDIQMPVMDGLAATIEIRNISDKKKAGIPIIAMTANAFEEDKQKCLSVGMNGHIPKPLDASVISRELSAIFK